MDTYGFFNYKAPGCQSLNVVAQLSNLQFKAWVPNTVFFINWMTFLAIYHPHRNIWQTVKVQWHQVLVLCISSIVELMMGKKNGGKRQIFTIFGLYTWPDNPGYSQSPMTCADKMGNFVQKIWQLSRNVRFRPWGKSSGQNGWFNGQVQTILNLWI